MTGMLRKGMSWLGLGPDDEYDDYDFVDDAVDRDAPLAAGAAPRPIARPQAVPNEDWDDVAEPGGIRVLPVAGSGAASAGYAQASRPRSVVRPLPTPVSARPQVVTPTSFNDAQEVGDLFKKRQPVIVNLQGLDRDLARRLLDFASGVTYGLGGTVERVASHVYLLTPSDMEVSAEERRRIRESGLE